MSEEIPKSIGVHSLNERDVEYFFGPSVAAQGNSYQSSGRVLSASFDRQSRKLSGEVQGSLIRPYEVEVRLAGDGIKGTACSCAMRTMCKHGAALALDLLRSGRISRASLKSTLSAQEQEKGLYYLLDLASGPVRLILNVVHASKLPNGKWTNIQKADLNRITLASASYITEEDCGIARMFVTSTRDAGWLYRNTFTESTETCKMLLQRILATERCYWKELGSNALRLGAARQGKLHWETQIDGKQALVLCSSTAGDVTIIAAVAWYLNLSEWTLGPLMLSVPPQAFRNILNAGPVELAEAVALVKTAEKSGVSIPAPKSDIRTKVVKLRPIAKLQLTMRDLNSHDKPGAGLKVGKAQLEFDYGRVNFERAEVSEIRRVENNNVVIYNRDLKFEAEQIKQLEQEGLQSLAQAAESNGSTMYGFTDGTEVDWLKFSLSNVPKLQELGWKINFDSSFNLQVVKPEEHWSIDVTEGSDFWFSLDLGITVDGKKLPLFPIICQALRLIPRGDIERGVDKLNHDGVFYAPLSDGRHLALSFERVKKIVESFVELFKRNIRADNLTTNLSMAELLDLSGEIGSFMDSQQSWAVGVQLRSLLERVKCFKSMEKVTPPPGFGAELRPYQLEGLSWLNFLREFQLGGVLADDMGLGKTVQTLAHISLEKAENRLKNPFLVVCPTSVLPNWMSEIEKFTPQLKATAFWGPERSRDVSRISDSDIVVTTYPLLSRDTEILGEQKWKAVVLDEAQMIKNPNTQISHAVAKLKCDYRMCLTGTPVENHLGELWSQFNFLMPGFLQDLPTFTKLFRTPIEKQNDKDAQKLLGDRVRPFLLRRTKELVAKELPEKTIIIKRVELEGDQRDLYETVRVAMFEKVTEALSIKGLEKSQIMILDALLKLRQVCCDPRLLSMPAAKNVQSTAKLDLLISMLEELHAEGKRILLFSQFTSMLDLVIPELNKRGIDFVEIRGSSKDRKTPVQRFQNGEVPLFLLSLKSGGFGLNLTAADTVIHYDPWWNPAAENQATDRAHRIGQDKSVFVFKLIASGTIEERMLELQQRKQAIAEAVFDEENSLPYKLTADDLETLFKPLNHG